MSFFGFDPSMPRERPHNSGAPGFGPTPDPFAGLSRRKPDEDDDDALDFEDTYDGLGDELEEDRDAFNEDTFGASNVGTDFDFSGQGQKLPSQPTKPPQRQSRPQEQLSQGGFLAGLGQNRTSPRWEPSKPARSGYERYGKGSIPSLEPDARIWGTQVQTAQKPSPASQAQAPSIATATKKMMSLDEVEASLRAHKRVSPAPNVSSGQAPPNATSVLPIHNQRPSSQSFQEPPQFQAQARDFRQPDPAEPPMRSPFATTLPQQDAHVPAHVSPPAPHVLQNQARQVQPPQAQVPPRDAMQFKSPPMHTRGPSLGGQIVTHPSQLTQLPEEQRAALLAEDARRAKRNHKIHLLSRDNGLMTPQDKNFITRIQLQQLVAATGGAEENRQEAALVEDFYYVVLSQIRGAASNQPSSHFAQTYLNQLAWRGGNRRHPRGGDNHMRRMEQQVQRAVEAAKARPANRQLVVEGSLGKISFSNARTPRPLLNVKRHDSYDATAQRGARPKTQTTAAGRKAVLKDIEAVYSSLMKMEDHERKMPPPPTEESSADEIQGHMDWRTRIQDLNKRLWEDLKVLEPISSE